MRNELNLMELADQYLHGEMNASDRAAFEERMRSNPELQQLVDDQRALHGGMQRLALRPAVAKAYRNYKLGKWLPGIGGAVLVAVLAVGGWMLAKDSDMLSTDKERHTTASELAAVLPDTTGTGLPPLVLTIDPKADTTLLTPNGLVLDIPQGAFVDSTGRAITTPVRVTLLEAISGTDIMKAGLSTMSGDTLLETGGMFYIDAQVDGKRVGIDPAKPLTVMVPADNADPRMMLYQGVLTDEGIVDWRDPKPLPRTLVPVDITTLDFYPPGYLTKLAELGQDAENRAFRDSLYWSFSGALTRYQLFGPEEYNTVTINNITADTIYGLTDRSADMVRANANISTATIEKGAYLFAEHCASCHKPTRDMTGPALAGARRRWEGQGDIHAWVRNSQAVIKSGNTYANRLFTSWKKSPMTPNNLSDTEIDMILNYVDFDELNRDLLVGIDPAKVKAIWNERFNNTNLATREFEERMREIHLSCNDELLDLYAKNLDKNLSHLDSMAVRMGHGAFASFALQNDGRVELPPHAAERLKAFYLTQSRIESEAIRQFTEKYVRQQREQDIQAARKRDEHALVESIREGQLFQREFEANLDTVYKQLGYQRMRSSASAWVVPVTNPGWWNVDKAVLEATTSRTSMSYTDDRTGKTATLTYTPITIEVADRASFSDIRVYLIPTELNSYQRVVETDGAFTERLNASFNYDVIAIGRKNGQQHAGALRKVNGQQQVTVAMAPADDDALSRMLPGPADTKRIMNEMVQQARHLAFLEREAKRQKANQAQHELRNALLPVVFPCAGEGAWATSTRPVEFE